MRVSFDHSHDESSNAGERIVDAALAVVHRGSFWGIKYAMLDRKTFPLKLHYLVVS